LIGETNAFKTLESFALNETWSFLGIYQDTIKISVKEMGSENVNCIEMNQKRFQWAEILL
jgi:hypothetical protein